MQDINNQITTSKNAEASLKLIQLASRLKANINVSSGAPLNVYGKKFPYQSHLCQLCN